MPSFLVPRHVSTHRVAAIALYRALLRQSSLAPLLEKQREELQSIVRNRFRQTQHAHSYRGLRVAFQAGYEAIDYLDASVAGQDESTSYLISLLERAPAKVKAAPAPRLAAKEKEKAETVDATATTARKPSDAIFARPRPLSQLSGKRRVPVLYSANRIPVLRIKKPQSHSLSRFLSQRIKQRQRRHDLQHSLVQQIEFAKYEDIWDFAIAQQHGVARGAKSHGRGHAQEEESSWACEYIEAQKVVEDAIKREGRKNKEMAERMQGIVDQEQELYDRERQDSKEIKRQEKINRRRSRREGREMCDNNAVVTTEDNR